MSKALATNVASIVLSAALVLGFAFAFATPAKADQLSDLQAQVNALLAQIAALQGSSTTMSGGGCFTFTLSEKMGSRGTEVMHIQQFLNGHGFTIATTGAGSPGNETTYFGGLTKAAVVKFQNANAATILTPLGLKAGTGFWGPSSRAAANSMCTAVGTGGTGGTGTSTVVTSGTGVSIMAAATQPAVSLAPEGAARVPFTTFTLTNNSSAAVTITSITVQRTGLAQDAAFSGVVLLDSTGLQIGISHTFNSNHQTNIGDTFTLNPGQSMTYTVAGNMAADLTSYAGQVATIDVVGVNTTVPVSGTLPIHGTSQTLNATLSIGTFSTSTSSYDPGAAQTKNIGDTAVRFTGARFTASSAEDLKLYSIRWRQTGTASASDFSNVQTFVNGTAYPTTVDSSGKYYTTNFPGGILIAKGNSTDVYVQGDLTGSNLANRTIEMDIDKGTDIYFVGQVYGYGATDKGCGSAQCTGTPWWTGHVTTVNGGSATTIQNAVSVPAANVPLNVNNTVLGGFQTNFLGEPVTVTGIKVAVATSSGATGGGLTSVSIVDENGAVVSGPVDEPSTATNGSLLTFTDSVTFPTGLHTYTLKGKIPTGWSNGSTIVLSTTPSSQWTSPTGQTTGNSVTLPSSVVTMNTMTVQAASLKITASPNPAAQTIVAGNAITFGNIQLDAQSSGEDIRLSTLPVSIIVSATANATDLNTCQLYDGTTALNTGSNVVNPKSSNTETTNSTTAATFTLDNNLTVAKGTTKTLALKCNVVSSPTLTTVQIGVNSSDTFTATGVQSGASVTPTATTGTGGLQTLTANGSLTVTVDTATTPSLTLVSGGTTGINAGVVKFHASNEAINLTKLGLTLVNSATGTKATADGNGSFAATDLTTVHILNASGTEVGTAVFTGTNLTATSTLTTVVNVPANSDAYLTLKVDVAGIGSGLSGGIGDKVVVDPLNAEGTGASSGKTIATGATAGTNGVKLFKSYPTVALGTVTSCTNLNSCTGTNEILKEFTVSANTAGNVGVEGMSFAISTSSASLTNVKLYAFTDPGYSIGVANQNSGTGLVGGLTLCSSGCTATSPTLTFYTASSTPVEVPASGTVYFALKGTVSPSATTWTVNATLNGTSSAPTPLYNGFNMSTSTSPALGSQEFIWSDNASTTAVAGDVDWTNGFQVPGLSSAGI